MSDDEDGGIADALRGGFNTLGKTALLTGIGAAVLLKSVKEMVVGDPPSPIRKTLVYGTAALAIGYTACNEQINTAGSKAYKYFRSQQAQRLEHLEDKAKRQAAKLKEAHNVSDSLRERVDQLQTTFNARLDSLTDAYQEANEAEQDGDAERLKASIDSLTESYEDALEHITSRRSAGDTVVVAGLEDNQGPHRKQPRRSKAKPRQATKDKSCWHPVQRGETLGEIAADYLGDHDKHSELQTRNDISDPRAVPVGFPLRLDKEPCPARTTEPPKYTVIQRSNSLLDDLNEFDANPAEIIAYNADHGNDITTTKHGERVAVYTP